MEGKISGHLFDTIDFLFAPQKGPLDDKVAAIWDLVAPSRDSCITRSDLSCLLKETCAEGKLSIDSASIEKLTSSFFMKASRGGKENIYLEDFRNVMKMRPELVQSFLDRSADAAASEVSTSGRWALPAWLKKFGTMVSLFFQIDDVAYSFWISVFAIGQIAGFVVAFCKNDAGAHFDVEGWTLPVAKGSAKAIQVICVIFPFTMARSFQTFIRSSKLAKVLPMNKTLDIHKELGYHFLLWSIVHTVCHFINIARLSDASRHHDPDVPLKTQRQMYGEEVQITGLLLVFFLIFGYVFAVNWPGRKRLIRTLKIQEFFSAFEVFYVTHAIMGMALLVLLILHPRPAGKSAENKGLTWVYLAPGTIVCVMERLARTIKRLFCRTSVVGVSLHEGGVTEIQIQKPRQIRRGFRHASGKAGQYCFLNIPELAKYEWHPFSLTSGPEDPYISFHIQGVGGWTKGLYSLCEQRMAASSEVEAHSPIKKTDLEIGEPEDCSDALQRLQVNVDGPFGAPAQDHSSYSCLLLVGAGMGVTPFLAVLKQLMTEYNKSLCDCCKTPNSSLFKPRKVYFYWLTRDQTAPQYFKETLEDIKQGASHDFLEINICLTKALPLNDPRLAVTNVANSIRHDIDSFDTFTGTYQPSPCLFGRPNWTVTLAKISRENPGSRVGVFVCGPKGLSNQLRNLCVEGSKEEQASSQRTKFVFHTEFF